MPQDIEWSTEVASCTCRPEEFGTEVIVTLEQRAERYVLGSKPRPSPLIRDLLAEKRDRIGVWLSLGAVASFGAFFAILLLVH